MANNGIFIVLEGTDGSGKGTQFDLLVERLHKEGHDVAMFDFPQYKQDSSYFVREYLNGNYGTAEEVGPYTGSLFYALDRYQAANEIKEALQAGKVVIANRFTGSNMAHQGTKFNNAQERKGYYLWLDAIEFQMLGIPRPDLSVVLRVPAETAQKLVDRKEARDYTDKKRDLHEADLSHLKKAVEVYDNLCQLFPKDFKQLDCVRNDELLSIEAIHNLVWQTVSPLLPTDAQGTLVIPKSSTPKYFTPQNFDPETTKTYTAIMDEILKIQTAIAEVVESDSALVAPLFAALPAEEIESELQTAKSEPRLDNTELSGGYSFSNETIRLYSVAPRNELDLVPSILYKESALTLTEIQDAVETWNYSKKSDVLVSHLEADKPLYAATYSWDVMTAYCVLKELKAHGIGSLTCQSFSPRSGYAMPQSIEDADVIDEFETCFDLSLKLYSVLQSAGYDREAQYAILNGHKVRYSLTLNAHQLRQLLKNSKNHTNESYRKFIESLVDSVQTAHPLTGQHLA